MKKVLCKVSACLLILIAVAGYHNTLWAQTTRNVCKSGCAYSSIQTAINDSFSGDTVSVGDGIYTEHIDFFGKSILVQSVNGPEAAIIDSGGSFSVVSFSSGEKNTAVLNGFTIQNGSAVSGGGIYIADSSSPTIMFCVIKDNSASNGAGIYVAGSLSVPEILFCTIKDNHAAGAGGGIYMNSASPSLAFNLIKGNTAVLSGGGIACHNSSLPNVSFSIIKKNEADNHGGGIANTSSSAGIFHGCLIQKNRAGDEGGGLYCENLADPQVNSCIITGNTSTKGGGLASRASSPTLVNCAINGNLADNGGGIYSLNDPAPMVHYTTLSGNRADASGGGISCNGNNNMPEVVNSIVWGNKAPIDREVHIGANADISIVYSDVRTGDPKNPWIGMGNIAVDPLFVRSHPAGKAPSTKGDYHLRHKSPCIDAADPSSLLASDIDGDTRPLFGGYDMGGDEAGLVHNFSFEYGGKLPGSWKGGKLAEADRRVTTKPLSGQYSFVLTGSGKKKYLKQAVVVSGGSGDRFRLGGWSRSKGTSKKGGPYKAEAKIYYTDDTTGKFKLEFTRKTHGWEYMETTFDTDKPYDLIEIYLRYGKQTGKAWFDEIRLVNVP